MNQRPGKIDAAGVRVETLPYDAPAGHFCFERDDAGTVVGLRCGCPCGCGAHHGARFTGPGAWGWDGNVDKPTVTGSFGMYPSFRNESTRDGKYHWHGHLVAGDWVEC